MMIELKHQEGLQFLSDISDNSVDLILTDPPYITSRDSGMDKWVDHIAKQDTSGSVNVMTQQDWDQYKTEEQWNQWFENSNVDVLKRPNALKKMKADFLKYGSTWIVELLKDLINSGHVLFKLYSYFLRSPHQSRSP